MFHVTSTVPELFVLLQGHHFIAQSRNQYTHYPRMPSQQPAHVMGNLPPITQPMIPPPPLRSNPATYSTQGTLPYGSTAMSSHNQQSQEPPPRNLSAVPADISGSKQSFQQAMGNPCEFFVDVM